MAEIGEGGEEHQVRVSSRRSILEWMAVGLALVAVSIWLLHVYAPLIIATGPLALTAFGTAFAKSRENRWLRPSKR